MCIKSAEKSNQTYRVFDKSCHHQSLLLCQLAFCSHAAHMKFTMISVADLSSRFLVVFVSLISASGRQKQPATIDFLLLNNSRDCINCG